MKKKSSYSSTLSIVKWVAFFFISITHLIGQTNGEWWKRNNLRVIQLNLPDYEAATIHPDSVVEDLVNYSANTLIINAGGIMAFYPSKLESHYINPYMRPAVLADIIKKCHQNKIKVIVRFDFSRADRSIFDKHPNWFYISEKGERMVNTDKYVVSINAPYVQEVAFQIVNEVIENFPIDGIFQNMPGYQTRNAYENLYQGIDQNEFDKKAFFEYSGMKLPTIENKQDSVFKKYEEFKKFSTEKWQEKMFNQVKSKNPNIAICTYADKFVDIIRHESQTNSLPYWPYSASDNVGNAANSYPNHVI
ncbi:MAG: family 10 glycosylhydrolase, partial [Bacteroidota bacterium]